MRHHAAQQRQFNPKIGSDETKLDPDAGPETGPAGAPPSAGQKSPIDPRAVTDLLVARLPSPNPGGASTEAARPDAESPTPRGWPLAFGLCLLAWLAAAILVAWLPGGAGWIAGGLALIGVPAAWLAWQVYLSAASMYHWSP